MHITKLALQQMGTYPSPPTLSALAMASTALMIEKNYLQMLEILFKELESSGELSLGLNDFLAASANSHENHVYLLQQRVKTEIDQ
jgi:hypothetical protein